MSLQQLTSWRTQVCAVELCELCDDDPACSCSCHATPSPDGEEPCGCTISTDCAEHHRQADHAFTRGQDR